MVANQMRKVMQHLHRSDLVREGAGQTDGQLLGCFIEQRDAAAFAALVRRHGPMVWGVCCRLLHPHDAEDAFQATFLVLVRKAASIVPRERVANWLYGVAHQTALQARRNITRRRAREKQVTEMPEPAVAEQTLWPDLRPLLDQELSRLPDAYREALVLCDLEGKTRQEVAQQLGLPEGTVASRLARARAMLAKRLARRGIALSGGALAGVLFQQAASAGVPNAVVDSTIKAATLLAAGQAAATGVISLKVATLTEGVLKAMLVSKLKAAIALVLILGLVATGATLLTCRTAAGQDGKEPAAEQSVKRAAKQETQQDKDEGIVTAWGKEVGGLQAGLGFRPGAHRAYHYDETVTLVVRVRNVGKHTAKFSYLYPYIEHSPTVTDSDGKPIPQPKVLPDVGGRLPRERELAPGKEIELHELKRHLRPASESASRQPLALYGTGKVAVQYDQVLGPRERGRKDWKLDPALSRLATGKLELEVEAEKKEGQKTDVERLQGKWEIVSMGRGGLPVMKNWAGRYNVTFKGDTVRFLLYKDNMAYPGSATVYARYRLDPSARPKTIHLIDGTPEALFNMEEVDRRFADAAEQTHGIYAFDGDTLRLCFSRPKGRKGPAAIENKKKSNTLLYVLKRVPKKAR